MGIQYKMKCKQTQTFDFTGTAQECREFAKKQKESEVTKWRIYAMQVA